MIYELQPFNQARFDACMAWVAKEFDRTLSQYEAVKIHATADVLHVVKYHRPIIGGTFKKLANGPVSLDALNRAKGWDDDGAAPLKLAFRQNKALHFARKPGVTKEAIFTPSERETILQAARLVFSMTFGDSQKFFHGEAGVDNFLGRAWRNTRMDKAPISWEHILDAFAKQTGANADSLKSLVCL